MAIREVKPKTKKELEHWIDIFEVLVDVRTERLGPKDESTQAAWNKLTALKMDWLELDMKERKNQVC